MNKKSVTRVLNCHQEEGIINWKLNVGKTKAKKISEDALRIGTKVDLLVQDDINNGKYDITECEPQVVNAMRGWEKFKTKYPEYVDGVEDMQVELIMDDIVGHPDIRTVSNIDDIKTGNRLIVRPKYVVQVCRYAVSAGKSKAGIIILSKTRTEGAFLYIQFEGQAINYFGCIVFDAFCIVYEYEFTVRNMVRNYLEKEKLE